MECNKILEPKPPHGSYEYLRPDNVIHYESNCKDSYLFVKDVAEVYVVIDYNNNKYGGYIDEDGRVYIKPYEIYEPLIRNKQAIQKVIYGSKELTTTNPL